jgi:hypothetical protein
MSAGEYPRSPLLGLPIEIVQPGTVIAHAETGHEMTVDETCAAISGGKVYMTRRVYDLATGQFGEGRMAQ